MKKEELEALLGLNAVPGLGPGRIHQLLQRHKTAELCVKDAPECFSSLPAAIRSWDSARIVAEGKKQMQQLSDLTGEVLHEKHSHYPAEFHHLGDVRQGHPPPVVMIRGDPHCVSSTILRIAIIGARACTPYGKDQAFRLGAGLAASGIIVVSGAARGIDQAAMRGALSVGGKVVAVLGSGMERPYPPDAQPLLNAIMESDGCVMTEFGFWTIPSRGNFPRRNRLIAALARGTVVVEAGPKSGSMNTVGWCIQLGREVFAVPGPVNGICSRGPHQLLREGAHFTEGVADILAEFKLAIPREIKRDHCPILNLLKNGDSNLEALAFELGRGPDDLLPELMELELEGKVVRLPGGIYHRCGPS